MDLLGGYGSGDDDASSSSSSGSITDQQAAAPPSQQPQPQPQPQHSTTTVVKSSSKQSSNTSHNKKQRKLLSLNAVLPAEVFERLVRHQERDAGNADVSYSSSEDEEAEHNTKIAASTVKRNQELQVSACSRLLDQLHSKKMAPKNKKQEHEGSLKLGAAFLSVTTSTTRTSKKRDDDGDDDEVVDIHAVSRSADYSSRSSDGVAIKPRQEDSTDDVHPAATGTATVQSQSKSLPAPTPATTTIRRAVNVVRSINSAPGLPHPEKYQYQTEKLGSGRTVAGDMNHQHMSSSSIGPASNSNDLHLGRPDASKKMTRKDMQKALRAGNFDSVLKNESVAQYQQTVSQYQASDAVNSNSYATADRVRHVAVGLYDPKEGATVQTKEVTGAHRSKHQIHQLVHSAAALEAQLAQKRTVKGSSSRVDAKRKYGW